MLICHKLVASNGAAVLKNVICQTCMQYWPVRFKPASWEVVCQWAPHPVLSITSGFSNIKIRQWRITTTTVAWGSCRTHENCVHAEQIIIVFYIYFFISCSIYLVLFSIVLYRTIVTVYTDNIFIYNYLQQMHQIIHLSPVGCFTPARGKSIQKNREVSGVKQYWCYGNRSEICNSLWRWTHRNRGDICLSPASREATHTNKPP